MCSEQPEPDCDVRPDDAAHAARDEREGCDLHRYGRCDDPRIARLVPRQVIPDEDVHEREEHHRDGEGHENLASLRELGAEARMHEPTTRHRVEQREQGSERRSDEQRASEDVGGVLTARLTCGRSREQDGENRHGEEERQAGERRGGGVFPGVLGEPGPHHEDVDVREHRDADQADDDRPQIAQKRGELRARYPSAASKRLADQP